MTLFKENNHIKDFKNFFDKYSKDLEYNGVNNLILETEYKLWQRKLTHTNNKPHNTTKAVTLCNIAIYPNIFKTPANFGNMSSLNFFIQKNVFPHIKKNQNISEKLYKQRYKIFLKRIKTNI